MMPTSNLAIAPTVLALAAEVPHASVLDIGPGHGKFATLLREYLPNPPTTIDACEMEPSYVFEFGLTALYREVMIADALKLPDEILARYDLVLMVDVIEHMEKADGDGFVRRVPGSVVISTPQNFFQNPAGLPESETHRCVWTRADFETWEPTRDVTILEVLGGWMVRAGPRRG